MSRALLASLMIFAGASIWGVYWIPLRMIEEAGVTSGWAIALFNTPGLIGAIVVWLALQRRQARQIQGATVVAGLLAGFGLALYAMGLVHTTVVRATMLFYLTPVWGTLIGILVLRERPGPMRWLALVLALVGLGMVMRLGGGDLSAAFGWGEGFGLASGLAWAMAAVMIRRAGVAGADLTLVQFIGAVGGSCLLAVLMGADFPEAVQITTALSPLVIGFALMILLSVYAIFWAVAQISPGRSGILMMSEVIVAVLSAAILIPDEALSMIEWIGVVLIMCAALAEVFGNSAENPQSRSS